MDQDSDYNKENAQQFESRKQDHIRLSLDSMSQANGQAGFEKIQLIHEAFPEIDKADISLVQSSLGIEQRTPFIISSMTAGHKDSGLLNQRLAQASAERGWLMGVGSQRRELFDSNAAFEWQKIRQETPKVRLLGNIGITQLISSTQDQVQRLIDSLDAVAIYVHTNPLQESIQPEGTPQFRGGLRAITELCESVNVPVIVKETGCGFSKSTLSRLNECGVAAVEVSGFGGTHWGRIEGGRAQDFPIQQQLAETFANWGISTIESVLNAKKAQVKFEIWGSGGVRSGLDAAKLLAMGCQMVGVAQPVLRAALQSEEDLDRVMRTFESELETAMLCTGSATIEQLQRETAWQIQN